MQFAEILLTYANFPTSKHQKILKRLKKIYEKDGEDGEASKKVFLLLLLLLLLWTKSLVSITCYLKSLEHL